ncbi:TIGR03086 family metal-binding protein [Streptomyces solicathayae]|uniref:TIGR03086 family metal-binding protein n=1 Tax=Streptomyces solicathayae TaxID=3081768 RepID=A0ABZ0LVN4_9ACTN|nr:TIGR03086 family metal-binding protein [Streptomyces sp. HUAS YS2]WOX22843.1 TIGR03086 family metal-binding protein [Streptomyces sp. HUAS YS2]
MSQSESQSQKRISDLLDVAAAQAVPVLRGIGSDEKLLGARTPCAEYDVRALVNHLFQVVVQFQELAAKRDADFSASPDYVAEGGGAWADRFEAETRKLVAAWAEPGAEEGASGSMGLPARTVGSMALLDLTVHAWDLARATGRPFEPDPAVVDGLAPEVERMAPMGRRMNVFGDAVSVGDSATAFERLLAVTGRDVRVWA